MKSFGFFLILFGAVFLIHQVMSECPITSTRDIFGEYHYIKGYGRIRDCLNFAVTESGVKFEFSDDYFRFIEKAYFFHEKLYIKTSNNPDFSFEKGT